MIYQNLACIISIVVFRYQPVSGAILNWRIRENQTRCYNELGCINITRSWYDFKNRKLNFFPLERDVINTQFVLYTRRNPYYGELLNVNSEDNIKASHIKPLLDTKLIVHGYMDKSSVEWVHDMKNELLKAGDYNVVLVDWSGGNILYIQSVANTRLVGLEIAYFVNTLKERHDLNPNNVHIIGHSLGSHIAGYAGERIQNLGRITGLDPAMPGFQGMPPHVRLDPTDALFVDVIHTDAAEHLIYGFGILQPVGNLDFYPNSGKDQPGCDRSTRPSLMRTIMNESPGESTRLLMFCDHDRVLKLFTESINGKCSFIAQQCPSFEDFLSGNCFDYKHGYAVMGYRADKTPGFGFKLQYQTVNETNLMRQQNPVEAKYFLSTGKEPPFCRIHYKITIHLANPVGAKSQLQGALKITLESDFGIIRDIDLIRDKNTKLIHGSSYSTIINDHVDLGGKIKKAQVWWNYKVKITNVFTYCVLWCNKNLYVESITVNQIQLPATRKRNIDYGKSLCETHTQEYAEIPHGGSVIFYDNCRQ